MSIINRNDRVLLVALAVSMVVIFAKPIQRLLDMARDVEQSSALTLIPALLILSVVFIFHQQAKRQEAKAQAAAAEAAAVEAQARALEMERLVLFGQSLGRSLDFESIAEVVRQHLPTLASTEDAWVMVRNDKNRWQALVGAARGGADLTRIREHIAHRAIDTPAWTTDPQLENGHLCLPVTAGGYALGVLGVPESAGPFNDARRRELSAAATLLGISLRNAQLFREVRENSVRDSLTGCFNRTHALEAIDTELRRASRTQQPLSVVLFDIDHFKDINDRFGHLCGDSVLAAVGARMREVLRGSDLKSRYGGEEFLILLPETPLDGARRVADTLRKEIAGMSVRWKSETLTITASFGVAMAAPSETDPASLLGRADAALYRAKQQGRNCVRLSVETAVA